MAAATAQTAAKPVAPVEAAAKAVVPATFVEASATPAEDVTSETVAGVIYLVSKLCLQCAQSGLLGVKLHRNKSAQQEEQCSNPHPPHKKKLSIRNKTEISDRSVPVLA